MMAIALVGPIGFLPSERQTRAKPPSNISQVSVKVTGPPGPIGPSFILPSKLHLPAKAEIALCSGPGMGIWGSSAVTTAVDANTRIRIIALFIIFLQVSKIIAILALYAPGHDPRNADGGQV